MAIVSREKLSKFRLSKAFFYALIFLLPIGTRLTIETQYFRIGNFFSFYNAQFLHLTDLLILGLMIFWFFESTILSREKSVYPKMFQKLTTRISQDFTYRLLLSFWLILAVSMIISRETLLGAGKLWKISEYFFIFAYVRENINLSREIMYVFWLMVTSACIQAVFGIIQYFQQSSIGFQYLGEEYLRPGLKGVAEYFSTGLLNPVIQDLFPYLSPISNFSLNIRAYGTFPHPNIFGGFFFVCLIAAVYLYFSQNLSRERQRQFAQNQEISRERIDKIRERLYNAAIIFSIVLFTTGLVVTFSRTAWLAAVLGLLILFAMLIYIFANIKKFNDHHVAQYFKLKKTILPIVLVMAMALGINLYIFSGQIKDRVFGVRSSNIQIHAQDFSSNESREARSMFNNIALRMILQKPLFGVGLGNFVNKMGEYTQINLKPHEHQPVHNIYLLITAEAGILAGVVFVLILLAALRNSLAQLPHDPQQIAFLSIFAGLLMIGMFDHYLWTIQQGSLMLWLTLGLMSGRMEN